jgi:hypothetical protein
MTNGWERDGADSHWFTKEGVGAVQGYESCGMKWWFYPEWLPDENAHDVGPFKTRKAAFEHAECLARLNQVQK